MKYSTTDVMFNKSSEIISKPTMVNGDGNTILVTPSTGKRLYIKAITIVAEGNSGEVMVVGGDGTIYLPLWVTVQSRAGTSSVLNIKLARDESLRVITTGRSSNDTFVGVTYTEGFSGNPVSEYELFLTSEGEPVYTSDDEVLYVRKEG